ncbi:hypothetical protein [Citreicoccus inhibens]|uniref:hypothetical protein n=1 Tax=Citreicoccus inhibens TaxID=2849499 RepID=UPI002E2904C7|nr:hypothetical protein [Citreicoccus inhibens]
MKLVLAAPLLATALLARCKAPDGCTSMATRCAGNVAQICNADGSWQVLADCDAVSNNSGSAFTCAYVNDEDAAGYTCAPADSDAGNAHGGVL